MRKYPFAIDQAADSEHTHPAVWMLRPAPQDPAMVHVTVAVPRSLAFATELVATGKAADASLSLSSLHAQVAKAIVDRHDDESPSPRRVSAVGATRSG